MSTNLNIMTRSFCNKNRIEKIFKNLYLIIGVIPALFIVSLIIFHYYSTTLIGYEPSINFPYYYIQNDFNFNLLKLIFIWQLMSLCCVFLFPGLLLINLILDLAIKIELSGKFILLSFLSCLSMILVQTGDSPLADIISLIID